MKVRDGSIGVLIFLVVVFVAGIFMQEKSKSERERAAQTTQAPRDEAKPETPADR